MTVLECSSISVTLDTGKTELGGKQILLDIPRTILLFVVAVVTFCV